MILGGQNEKNFGSALLGRTRPKQSGTKKRRDAGEGDAIRLCDFRSPAGAGAKGEEKRLLERLLHNCMDAIALSSLDSFKDEFRLCEKLFLEGITNPKEQ